MTECERKTEMINWENLLQAKRENKVQPATRRNCEEGKNFLSNEDDSAGSQRGERENSTSIFEDLALLHMPKIMVCSSQRRGTIQLMIKKWDLWDTSTKDAHYCIKTNVLMQKNPQKTFLPQGAHSNITITSKIANPPSPPSVRKNYSNSWK